MILGGQSEAERFVDGRRRGWVIFDHRLGALGWKGEIIVIFVGALAVRVLGGGVESHGGIFELLGFYFQLIQEFDLAVAYAHQPLSDAIRIYLFAPVLAHANQSI